MADKPDEEDGTISEVDSEMDTADKDRKQRTSQRGKTTVNYKNLNEGKNLKAKMMQPARKNQP